MGKTINMGDFDPLLGNLEEYVNKQGCTLGKEAEILQELLHCIQYCYYRGYHLNDKVRVLGKTGYISGFTGGAAYVKDSDNQYITLPNKAYKQVGISNLQHVCHNNNWQYITKTTA